MNTVPLGEVPVGSYFRFTGTHVYNPDRVWEVIRRVDATEVICRSEGMDRYCSTFHAVEVVQQPIDALDQPVDA